GDEGTLTTGVGGSGSPLASATAPHANATAVSSQGVWAEKFWSATNRCPRRRGGLHSPPHPPLSPHYGTDPGVTALSPPAVSPHRGSSDVVAVGPGPAACVERIGEVARRAAG